MWIRKSSQSTVTHKGVASLGPMAPFRSHHRNHTRQEWIIIVIRQELSPVTFKLEEKQINLRRYTPDRHRENGSILWRDGKNHQNDVTTSYATASRCVTTVEFRGETDRITTCRYKILRPVSHPPNVHSFVGTARTNGAVPPALVL